MSIFLPSLEGGGAERAMLNLARGFADRGLRVHMVLASAVGPYLSLVPQDVRVVDLQASRVLRSLPALARYLRRERPAAMISALNHANIVAVWAKRLARFRGPVLTSIQNTFSQAAPSNDRAGRFMPRLLRLFLPWSDAITAVSEGVADDLSLALGIPRDTIHVVHNAVVTPELLERAREAPEHRWVGSNESAVVIGVGSLHPQKDFPTLISAFAKVRAQRKARLIILGEGAERPRLEALIRDLDLGEVVDLPGFANNPYAIVSRASVFVLSSAYEGLPTVLIEAMAVGTSVVATDCKSGPREILNGGEFGKLVPVGDADALAEAIVTDLDRPMSPSVLRDRSQLYALDTVAQRYIRMMGLDTRSA